MIVDKNFAIKMVTCNYALVKDEYNTILLQLPPHVELLAPSRMSVIHTSKNQKGNGDVVGFPELVTSN